MNPTDYEYEKPEVPYEEISKPRPRASQEVAKAKRDRRTDDAPTVAMPRDVAQMLPVAVAVVLIGAVIVALTYSVTRPAPMPLAIPTEAPARTPSAPPTTLPAPTSAPIPTIAPTDPPVPTEAVLAPMTGRGNGPEVAAPVVEPPAPAAAPSYVENVGAQAPHSPRGDGKPGPSGGDWVAVPTISAEQAAIIGAQKPHKVR